MLRSVDTIWSLRVKGFYGPGRGRRHRPESRAAAVLSRSCCVQGLGLYAARDIEKHTMVIEYIGTIIRNEVANRKEKLYESQVSVGVPAPRSRRFHSQRNPHLGVLGLSSGFPRRPRPLGSVLSFART